MPADVMRTHKNRKIQKKTLLSLKVHGKPDMTLKSAHLIQTAAMPKLPDITMVLQEMNQRKVLIQTAESQPAMKPVITAVKKP